MSYGQTSHPAPFQVSPPSGGLMLVGVFSIVVASITMLLALGGGLFVGTVTMVAAGNAIVTWTLTPDGAMLGSTLMADTTADEAEVAFMIDGMVALQPLGEVQEQHLRKMLAAHGRGAFPDAGSAQEVTDAIQAAAPDGVGGVYYALKSSGRFNVDAEGAEWLDPVGNRHFSGDLLDAEDVADMQVGDYGWEPDAQIYDAAIRRINRDLDAPLPADEAEIVRTHLADQAAMPMGWVWDATQVDDEILSAERSPNGMLTVELATGTYTLPAGSQNATFVAHNGMPTGSSAATGGWIALLGALGLGAAGGVLLAAGIQTVRLKHSGTWLHWIAVAGILVSATIALGGSAMFSAAMPTSSAATGLVTAGFLTGIPLLYALVLIGVLLFGPLRKSF